LKGLAEREGRSLSEQVEYLVEHYFAEQAFRSRLKLRGLTEKQAQELVEAAAKRAVDWVWAQFGVRRLEG
jgi:hypothetical protein